MNEARVKGLLYSVTWKDQHPLVWNENAFPVSFNADGWELVLNERTLDAAASSSPYPSVQDAREALEPKLDAWRAKAELEERVLLEFTFAQATLERLPGELPGVQMDVAGFVEGESVSVERSSPPAPDWSWRDTPAAQTVRLMCLRPVRQGRRPVADAGYWLSTFLSVWAGGDRAAAQKLKVSRGVIKRLHEVSGWSLERKVGGGSRPLTNVENTFLQAAIEELARRLQLAESDLCPGEFLDVSHMP
ncbi:hypothetical protein [Streptomyces sp. NBC_00582]|uniref:hypothetical protein n=1 Tax=Streptomyces sp. NBC_00582 TaxID=2975783 RepID=UPI002E7FCA74|nr:hypothetical protein [Streptomyces sp. NBC_00582]WUB68463.1 hypothetical protein OG852_50065 [Streptomyces sp. NBC_00582]